MSEAPEAAPKALLDYVPELVTELEAIQADQATAKAELARIGTAINQAALELDRIHREVADRPNRAAVCAEAALAGKSPPAEPKTPSTKDLEATIAGLKAMRPPVEQKITELKASLQGKTNLAIREAAERAAADYLDAVAQVERLHAEIGGAQRFLEDVGLASGGATLLGQNWFGNFAIPASSMLRTLKPAIKPGTPERLAGGYQDELYKAAQASAQAAKTSLIQRLGGVWPFAKS